MAEGTSEFVYSTGLDSQTAQALLLKYGRNELIEKKTSKWIIYLRGLWGPMPIAIWCAVIIEYGLQNWPDGSILLGILFANATISWYETTKAGDAVAALKKSLKPTAIVMRDGQWKNIDAGELVPGDLILLGSGSSIPADCQLHDCQLDVDEAALTGESMPVSMCKGSKEQPKMGSTVVRGEGEATVEFTGANTFFGRTAALLQSVGNELGGIQKLLIRVMIILTSLSFVLCLTALLYLIFYLNENVKNALDFTVVLLVASIPIAIEIVVTTTLAMGSREMARWKAIVTKLQSIEALAGMNMLCSDKTGTLTLNKMEIQDECVVYTDELNKDKLMVYAALAAKWTEPPRDALDRMILDSKNGFNRTECDKYRQLSYTPFDPVTKRTESTILDSLGNTFRVTKGAPHVILKLIGDQHFADTIFLEQVESTINDYAKAGTRCLCIAKTDERNCWILLGILTFLDPPRPDTKRTIEQARENGINVMMITGDHPEIAKTMGSSIGLGTNILGADILPVLDVTKELPLDLGEKYGPKILQADGFAKVFPEHKFIIVAALRQYGFTCGMTGDGVNDSPALKRADIGIAVSGATDAARAASAIVLTEEGLSVIIEAIIIARRVFNRIKSFMTYRISATLQLLTFFFISVFAFHPSSYQADNNIVLEIGEDSWPKYFSIPVLMLMLITLLNDGTLLTIGYDNVSSSKLPQKWNLKALFLVSSVLGSVACLSSLILLYGALDSHNNDGWFARWNLPSIPYPKIVSMIYLKVSISDFLTLFSSRTVEKFFWSNKPSPILLYCAVASLFISTMIASFIPSGTSLSDIPISGLSRDGYSLWPLWVWIYCVIWWIFQDCAKVGTYYILDKYDIFKYKSLATGLTYKTHDTSNVTIDVANTQNHLYLESNV